MSPITISPENQIEALELADELLWILKAPKIPKDLPPEFRDLPDDILREFAELGLLDTIPLEGSLHKILTRAYQRKAQGILDTFMDNLFKEMNDLPPSGMAPYEWEKFFDSKGMKNEISKLATLMEYDTGPDSPWAMKLAGTVEKYTGQAYELGRNSALQKKVLQSLEDSPLDKNAIRFLRKQDIYWITEKQKGAIVENDISRILINSFTAGVTDREKLKDQIKEALQGKYMDRKELYWRMLASNAINKSRNFGALQTLIEAGITEYIVYTKGDSRVCEFCMDMHGRVFQVKHAALAMNALYHADSPALVKDIVPWAKKQDFGQFANQHSLLVQKKFPMPPYHGNCRCAIVSQEWFETSIKKEKGWAFNEEIERWENPEIDWSKYGQAKPKGLKKSEG